MKKFEVTAEFVDKESGKRVKKGATVTASAEREAVLRKAGVIGDEVTGAGRESMEGSKASEKTSGSRGAEKADGRKGDEKAD